MNSALAVDRFQFAFTITFHYLFPQLTMGLALLILVLKTMHLRTGRDEYGRAARFWAKIFGINFALGVVTGIPMEFQFGTNWARFAKSAGGIIGQTLAMEGAYSFFLESTFLGLFLFGEKKVGRLLHWFSALCVFLGAWLSGFFIIVTDAFMQHPVGYTLGPKGEILLSGFWALLGNPWALWQYAHNMTASVVTASFVMSALGAFYVLAGRHAEQGRLFLRTGVVCGTVAVLLLAFPTGDRQGKMLARYQPVTLAAMEGLFENATGPGLSLVGQPDVEAGRLDNPVILPKVLSFLAFDRWNAPMTGLNAVDPDKRPDNIPLLYFSYHIMAGLGTLLALVMLWSALQLGLGRLYASRTSLWILLLAFPFPYIATIAGWMTAEIGRQPWLIYGLLRTADGTSPHVSAGSGMFTLLGFLGMYSLLALLFLFLVYREIEHGPEAAPLRIADQAIPALQSA